MPTINIRSQRHSTIFSTVLTRMTIIGKVKNMNQMETRNDFFISSKVINTTPWEQNIRQQLYFGRIRSSQDPRRSEYQDDDQNDKGKNIFIITGNKSGEE